MVHASRSFLMQVFVFLIVLITIVFCSLILQLSFEFATVIRYKMMCTTGIRIM